MFLRSRRSLPTEKARSPAPVITTTRMALVTATVSSDVGQQGSHLRRDGVVGVGAVEGDHGDTSLVDMVEQDGRLGVLSA